MNSPKKKILFISSNMHIGGFQKSLIAVLQCLDYTKYDVDLLLFDPSGIFVDLIPKQVNLLSPVIPAEYFDRAPAAIKKLLQSKQWALAIRRICAAIVFLIDKGLGASILSRGIPGLAQKYDAAIDYNGQHILYYLVDKIHAKRKISYFHSDYKKWPYYQSMDRKYYAKVDAIVTVSDLCVQSMKEVFPEYRQKIFCIENIISTKTVSLFPEGQNGFTDNFNGKRIVTVGRVCKDKGVLLALESCALLKKQGVHCRWYWIGPWDSQKEQYLAVQESLGLQNNFVFLGATNNPYDYMRQADIVAHPSYFEGNTYAIRMI